MARGPWACLKVKGPSGHRELEVEANPGEPENTWVVADKLVAV